MPLSTASSGGASAKRSAKEDISDLLKRLNFQQEEEDEFVWEEEVESPDHQAKWLAIAKVHTSKGFSPSALYAEMRSAWNPGSRFAGD